MKLRQTGAALLAAMLTVALVASMAAAALWQQWRSVEVETAERARVQSLWVLTGALLGMGVLGADGELITRYFRTRCYTWTYSKLKECPVHDRKKKRPEYKFQGFSARTAGCGRFCAAGWSSPRR